jgi:hypothetical protein
MVRHRGPYSISLIGITPSHHAVPDVSICIQAFRQLQAPGTNTAFLPQTMLGAFRGRLAVALVIPGADLGDTRYYLPSPTRFLDLDPSLASFLRCRRPNEWVHQRQ